MAGKHYIMLGAPGSGKGSVAIRIAKRLGLRHLSTGDLLREAVTNKTEYGRKAEQYMNEGSLVPDEIMLEIIHEELEEHGYGDWILDGFPRTLHQAGMLTDLLEGNGAQIDGVFLIDVAEYVIIQRLSSRRVCPACNAVYNIQNEEFKPKKGGICDKCGSNLIKRSDDEEETIRNRLKIYEKQTMLVIEYYRERGVLETVNGVGGAVDVVADVLRVAT